jgi:hypothetical protein
VPQSRHLFFGFPCGPQLLDLDSLLLTSPSLCGEIKVKVGYGRIEALHSLVCVGSIVTILVSLNQPARKSMTGLLETPIGSLNYLQVQAGFCLLYHVT